MRIPKKIFISLLLCFMALFLCSCTSTAQDPTANLSAEELQTYFSEQHAKLESNIDTFYKTAREITTDSLQHSISGMKMQLRRYIIRANQLNQKRNIIISQLDAVLAEGRITQEYYDAMMAQLQTDHDRIGESINRIRLLYAQTIDAQDLEDEFTNFDTEETQDSGS